MTRAVALFLAIFTGFTGLVYQVTWQKYLATLLGSHSEATAAVLGIFLGGLSLGYSVFGTITTRLVDRAAARGKSPNLWLVYGGIEAGIGIYALAFPWLFRGMLNVSHMLPHGNSGIGFVGDVIVAALLIGPPTVLMGSTIPVLTQALSRSIEDATRFHAFVYGLNTVGAFVGAWRPVSTWYPSSASMEPSSGWGSSTYALERATPFWAWGAARHPPQALPNRRAKKPRSAAQRSTCWSRC